MNSLSAFIVLGLMLMYFTLAVVPTANISATISDQTCTQGVGCFFFGNLGLMMVLTLIVVIFWWMFVG